MVFIDLELVDEFIDSYQSPYGVSRHDVETVCTFFILHLSYQFLWKGLEKLISYIPLSNFQNTPDSGIGDPMDY